MTITAVLFDLDGTLVDTAADLVGVLNLMLHEREHPPMPYAIARNQVSNGAVGLLRLGFGTDLADQQLAELRARFLELYLDRICINSRLFIGLDDIFNHTSAPCWGVVTNKPQAMSVALLRKLGIETQAGSIVGGDRLPQRKPHPAPLLLAAQELQAAPAECIYVGDAERDVLAGRAAGMLTAVAGYGYIPPAVDPSRWGADVVVRHPRELADALRQLGAGLR